MAAGVTWPDVAILVSSSDPNDANTVDIWTDLAVRTWRVPRAVRGRQYEIDQNLTGQAQFDFRNVDEWLNPANTTSPLLNLVKPMRRVRWMGHYPPGSTGNMLNATAGQDSTFESYTAGTLPAWLTPVGSTTPTVQAANPHAGTKSLQWSVVGNGVEQGVVTPASGPNALGFVPGRQYTASAWVRQSSASTQQIAVGGLTTVDTFGRSLSSGWGNATTGEAWSTISAGTPMNATDFFVAGGFGFHSQPVVNGYRISYLAAFNQADVDLSVTGSVGVMPVGGPLEVGNLLVRGTSITSYYLFRVQVETSGAITALIFNPSGTQLASTTVAGITYTPGMPLRVRAQAIGQSLNMRVWIDGNPQPTAWTLAITDSAYTGPGWVGLRSGVSVGFTGAVPVVFKCDEFLMSYVQAGTTTAATGAYTRLSCTFTATQPNHTLALTTIGTAVAGTVNLDDVQVEPGPTATANTTTGPLVRGFWGGHVGGFPVTWVPGSAGFEGSVSAPCVGPFAALAQIGIHTDYVTALLAKAPNYLWPLWDGSTATTFAEISGNNGSPLQRWDSPAGPSPTFTPGSPTNIPGDPAGAGVLNNGDPPGFPAFVGAVSSLRTGLFGLGPPITLPGTGTPAWSVTAAVWLKHDVFPTGGSVPLHTRFLAIGDPTLTAAHISFVADSTGPTLVFGGVSVADKYADGKSHLLIGVRSYSGSGTTITDTLWIDGVQVGTNTGTDMTPLRPVTWVNISADLAPTGYPGPTNGVYALFALWNRALSSTEIADLANAGKGYLGETSGARLARVMGNYYTGPTVIDLNSMSKMGPPSAPEATPLLQAGQRIQDTEAGNLFESRDGAVAFDGREVRFLRTVALGTFGDGGGAEIPYSEVPAPPVFGFDVTQTNNQALISQTNGIRAVSQPDTTGSIKSFYPRGYSLSVDCQSPLEAGDHANWVVANRAQPKQRVQTVTLDVGANPALFPFVMNLEIGQRYTVKRRPKAANSGAGMSVMSADYFLENVAHRDVDQEKGTWLVDLQLSPASLQPGIFDNATYGIFDQTLIFGF